MNTKQAIQEEFIKIYSQKEYNNITIKELCNRTPVARTTFYSYYQNIDDLKTDIETDLLNKIHDITLRFEISDLSFIDLHDFLKYTMMFIENNRSVIYAFLITQPNIRFINLWKEDIKKHFRLHYPQKENCHNYELLEELISSSAIRCYCYWLQHPKEIDDEKLFELAQATITSMIHAL
ncbi:MAG: hypothetical protein K2N85_15495 [Lachnospiraceae bacterium]|nr:hypothetical protein [Lachnospiraceae bacterium]